MTSVSWGTHTSDKDFHPPIFFSIFFSSLSFFPSVLQFTETMSNHHHIQPEQLFQEPTTISNRTGSSDSSVINSLHNSSEEELPRPILPWIESTNNTSQTTLHTMKQQSKPEKEFKEYKRWTWAKIWLLLMNSLVKLRER